MHYLTLITKSRKEGLGRNEPLDDNVWKALMRSMLEKSLQ
jgi:hypothetical protein